MGHQHGGGGPPLDSPALGLAARLRQGPGRRRTLPPCVLRRCAERENEENPTGTGPTLRSDGPDSDFVVWDGPQLRSGGHDCFWSLGHHRVCCRRTRRGRPSRGEGDCPGEGSARPSPLAAPAPVGSVGSLGPYRRPLLWPAMVIFNANGYNILAVSILYILYS